MHGHAERLQLLYDPHPLDDAAPNAVDEAAQMLPSEAMLLEVLGKTPGGAASAAASKQLSVARCGGCGRPKVAIYGSAREVNRSEKVSRVGALLTT